MRHRDTCAVCAARRCAQCGRSMPSERRVNALYCDVFCKTAAGNAREVIRITARRQEARHAV